ncbi:MAG: hypothetical protein HY911_03420 [Desulfobacterales bacterium]|nr:hypothetical protein [Desulfobacterales bacterium]
MKKQPSSLRLYIALTLLLIVLPGSAIKVYCGQQGVQAIITQAGRSVSAAPAADAAGGLPANLVQVHATHNGQPFWTETRKDKVRRFKCSQCHDNSTVTAENAAAVAHGDMVLEHGGAQKPLTCFTCHKEDQRDFFETQKGVVIDMDHVDELCGQCHFRQKRDWIGGAHGKRVGNWAGRRVVANCTACHDPHSPLFKKRWPATYALPLDKP